MSKNDEPEVLMTKEEYIENQLEELRAPIDPETGLKQLVVDYVGNKLNPDTGEVNLEMVIEVFAEEFREFVLPIAEENFIRGYQQAMVDVEDPAIMSQISNMSDQALDE